MWICYTDMFVSHAACYDIDSDLLFDWNTSALKKSTLTSKIHEYVNQQITNKVISLMHGKSPRSELILEIIKSNTYEEEDWHCILSKKIMGWVGFEPGSKRFRRKLSMNWAIQALVLNPETFSKGYSANLLLQKMCSFCIHKTPRCPLKIFCPP